MRTRAWVALGGFVAVAVVGGLTYAYVEAQPPGTGGVTGTFVGKDDTGLPDHALDEGTLLVIPSAVVVDVWPEVASPDQGPVYYNIHPRIDLDELAEDFDAVLVEVQPNGRFRINVESGPAVVCLLESVVVIGCVELELPERGSLRASRGEGGFFIE